MVRPIDEPKALRKIREPKSHDFGYNHWFRKRIAWLGLRRRSAYSQSSPAHVPLEPAMLRILGSARQLCDGFTRRELLRAGGLSLCGLSLADLLRQQANAAPEEKAASATFGKAKA